MNKNFAQQNAERRLRHSVWAHRRQTMTMAAIGWLSGLFLIAVLALAIAGPAFFLPAGY